MGLLKGVARVDGKPVIDGTMTFALESPAARLAVAAAARPRRK